MPGDLGQRVRVLRDCNLPDDALPIGRCLARQTTPDGAIKWVVVLDLREGTETWKRMTTMARAGFCCTGAVVAIADKDVELLFDSP